MRATVDEAMVWLHRRHCARVRRTTILEEATGRLRGSLPWTRLRDSRGTTSAGFHSSCCFSLFLLPQILLLQLLPLLPALAAAALFAAAPAPVTAP